MWASRPPRVRRGDLIYYRKRNGTWQTIPCWLARAAKIDRALVTKLMTLDEVRRHKALHEDQIYHQLLTIVFASRIHRECTRYPGRPYVEEYVVKTAASLPAMTTRLSLNDHVPSASRGVSWRKQAMPAAGVNSDRSNPQTFLKNVTAEFHRRFHLRVPNFLLK